MTDKKLRRKMRKRANKLVKWARKNGIEYVSEFVMLDGSGDDYVNVKVECDGKQMMLGLLPMQGYDSWS